MNASEPQFWMMIASIIIAIMFVVMAITLVVIAIIVKRVVNTVNRLEEKVNALITKVEPLMLQVGAIGEQGKEISVQFTEISENLSTATRYFSDSAGLIKEEVTELKQLVGMTAQEAREKVALVSRTIDRTQLQVTTTTDFVQAKVVEPAREIAAIMAGVRKGLEVLFAPSPKQIDRVYHEDEMFIG
jgi:predicted PurR-regulated permease PerM